MCVNFPWFSLVGIMGHENTIKPIHFTTHRLNLDFCLGVFFFVVIFNLLKKKHLICDGL